MKISTRGRYALRTMLYMAAHDGDGPFPIRLISSAIHVSPKYLEQIVSLLAKEGLIRVSRGNNGGYSLVRSPREYTAWEILRTAEGNMSPVDCLDCGNVPCENEDSCLSRPFWSELDAVIREYLQNRTLQDILEKGSETTCTGRSDAADGDP